MTGTLCKVFADIITKGFMLPIHLYFVFLAAVISIAEEIGETKMIQTKQVWEGVRMCSVEANTWEVEKTSKHAP
jgi:hypothetical protein